MSQATIQISEKTQKRFSLPELESFVNSEAFEDIIFGHQMLQSKTGETQSFASFRKEVWL